MTAGQMISENGTELPRNAVRASETAVGRRSAAALSHLCVGAREACSY